MVDERDIRALRYARTEFSRRGIDTGRADIRVRNGIVTVRGMLGQSSSALPVDLKHELEVISRVLRAKPEVRDVVIDAAYLS